MRDVLLLHHSHTDVGYTHFQDTVFALQRDYLRRAMRLAERYADGSPGEQLKWTCETTVVVEDLLRDADSDEVERLLSLHRRGLIDFGAMYCNVTPLYSPEMLARTLYAAGRLRRDYGLNIRYGMNCDVNGQSWGLVEMLLDAGVEGLSMAINRVMARDPQPRPSAFWWEGPSGRRLLVWHGETYGRPHHYGIPRLKVHHEPWRPAVYDIDAAYVEVTRYIEGLAARSYPYDFIYFQVTSTFLWDNGGPHEELVRFVREWNARGLEPRMHIVTLTELFERLRQQPPEALPVYRGDWTDWWAHGVSSSAFETALTRQSHGRLFAAQGLAALLTGVPNPLSYPHDVDEAAWRSLALYDEHTWGASDSVLYPSSPNTRGQWSRKATFAYEGAAAVTRLAHLAHHDLAARVAQPDHPHVLMYNPLPWPRSAPLYLPSVVPSGWELPQLEWHLELTSAQGPVFAAVDYGVIELPPCGYVTVPLQIAEPVPHNAEIPFEGRTPHFTPGPAPGFAPSSGVRAEGWVLKNRHYRLHVDSATGGIRSLRDTDDREWVDKTTPWTLGQYVYELAQTPRGRLDMQLEWVPPFQTDRDRRADLNLVRCGPERVLDYRYVRGVGSGRIAMRLAAPGVHDLHVQIVLYDDLPWIDLIYDVNKQEVTAPESIYIVFPFALDEPTARYEVAGAIVVAEEEQLRYACRDFYAVQNWIDLTDHERGITVATPDAPMVHIGGFTNHAYQSRLGMEQPFLVGWPCNNHWFTNFRASQSGWMRFRYRLLPHTSPFNPAAATRFGMEAAVDPLVGPVWDRPAGIEHRYTDAPVHFADTSSLMSLEPEHVQLIGLKPAEDGRGIIVRMQELAGIATRVRLRFPLSRIVECRMCSLAEDPTDDRRADSVDDTVETTIEPYRIQTLRVVLAPKDHTLD